MRRLLNEIIYLKNKVDYVEFVMNLSILKIQ